MDIVRFAISKPVTVTVGVLLVVMFGLIGVGAIPIQLAPNVDRPIVTVSTTWPGRSPQEIVDQITTEQETYLKNIENLKSMRSTSSEGSADITLEFTIGTNIDRALQDVADALRQVPEYPADVNNPVTTAADGASENAIAWIIIDLPPDKWHKHPDFDITTLYDALDKQYKPFLERVGGVARVNIFGGREREVRVLVDAVRLAQRGLLYEDVARALRAENANTSAGTIAEGKRDYRVRVVGQYATPEEILETVVAFREGAPVFVRDVAEVEFGHEKQRGFVRSVGGQAIATNIIRQTGSNVMEVMEGVRGRLAVIEKEILPTLDPVVGPDLRIRQVYDETVYITSAIGLVVQNLWIGGLCAALVLLLFLRSVVSTSVVAMAIPISVIGTFLVLLGMGRSLNVVSLAGLAFAVGMVVDNAIVVLENIYRRLQGGEAPMRAAHMGGREVWGAILASTLTTVAVFIPVLTIQEEAGQLFRDISLAIVAAVSLSLLVSITVIPAACSRWLTAHDIEAEATGSRARRAFKTLFGLTGVLKALNERIGRVMLWLMSGWRGWSLRPLIIVLMTAASLYGAARLMPPLDYLPAGNRNLVFGGLLIPPGYSVEQQLAVANRIEARIGPYVGVDPQDKEALAQLPPIFRREAPGEPFGPVPVDNFFIGSRGGGMFLGASSAVEDKVIPIGALLTNVMNEVPGAFGGARQSSIFGRGVGGSNQVSVEISGPRLDRVRMAANEAFNLAAAEFGYGNVRPTPANFNLTQPEFRVRVNNLGRELGLRPGDLGFTVRSLFDGGFVGEFRQADGETIDITLLPKGGRMENFQDIATIPVATPAGRTVSLDSVVELIPSTAAQEILRIEELPSVTIDVTPPAGRTIEEVMELIDERVLAQVRGMGLIDDTMRVRLEGTAAQLTEVKEALFGAPPGGGPDAGWQRALTAAAALLALGGLMVGAYAVFRSVRGRRPSFAYAAAGALLLGVVLAGLLLGVATNPSLATARLVWAIVVVYLLMCALFESFIYPFVIMFSVPLAVVGGFLGLRIVHDMTMQNPYLAAQQLDVLTMLGFVILIGVVVNNAILLVHQALNFMHGRFGEGEVEHTQGMAPLEAIAQAVRTRIRPIFMSTLTSVGGMTPLVLYPGAGSEMYRGLGSVVIGGLLVSTVFTLVLVPLLFSLVVQMSQGLRELRADRGAPPTGRPPRAKKAAEKHEAAEAAGTPEPALATQRARG